MLWARWCKRRIAFYSPVVRHYVADRSKHEISFDLRTQMTGTLGSLHAIRFHLTAIKARTINHPGRQPCDGAVNRRLMKMPRRRIRG